MAPRRNFEILAVLVTGISKLVFVNLLDLKFWFILITGTGWIFYLLLNTSLHPDRVKTWGFRREGFRKSLGFLLIPAMLVVALSYGYGVYQGHLILNWNLLPVLLFYPVWGTVQQWLVISLFGHNLLKVESLPVIGVYTTTALLFGIIHYPSGLLIAGTFLLALVYLYVFSKFQNLWALGVLHGWLGGIFYFFALGRDPWVEFTGSL